MAQVTQEDLSKVKDEVSGLAEKVGNLETEMGDLTKKVDSLDATMKQQIGLLVEKMNGSESRIVNKLWGIVSLSLALGMTVLLFFINLIIDSKVHQSSPVATQSSLESRSSQALLREMIRAELSALPTNPPSTSPSQSPSTPSPKITE